MAQLSAVKYGIILDVPFRVNHSRYTIHMRSTAHKKRFVVIVTSVPPISFGPFSGQINRCHVAHIEPPMKMQNWLIFAWNVSASRADPIWLPDECAEARNETLFVRSIQTSIGMCSTPWIATSMYDKLSSETKRVLWASNIQIISGIQRSPRYYDMPHVFLGE